MPLTSPFCRRALSVWLCGLCLGAYSLRWLAPPPGYAADLPVTVEVATTPPPDAIRPDGEAVRVTLTARLQGQALTAGHLHLTLTAPPRSTLLTTDFPHVEGTTLLDLDSDVAPDGTWSFQYIFPIRGVYTLALHVTPVPGGPGLQPTTLTKTVAVAENPEEVRNAWLFVAGLFLLGGIAGRLFARSAAARDIAQTAALLAVGLLSGGWLLGAAPAAIAQEHTHPRHASTGPRTVQGDDGWELTVEPRPGSATVGQLLELAIVLRHQGQVWTQPMEVSLTAVNQEDKKDVFQTTMLTQPGQSGPRLQFFDGAPHSVTVTARPVAETVRAVAPLSATVDLEVEALHPPMTVKLRLMALFIAILVGGMGLGFCCSGRLQEPQRV